MWELNHEKNNKIITIFKGVDKLDTIKNIRDKVVRYYLLCEGRYKNKDGSQFVLAAKEMTK